MNLGAHIIVASRIGATAPGFLLGAALPDIASMGGFRLLGSSDDVALTEGIAFHHRTDDAFHNHEWFIDVQRPLRASVLDAGLGRGASRAIGHVGPELLLDGWLIPEEADVINQAFSHIANAVDLLTPLVQDQHRSRWLTHLGRAASWRPGDDSHEPEAVARRLHRILQRRPRLSFDESEVGAVAECLKPTNAHIEATGTAFVAELVEVLKSERTERHSPTRP